MFSRNTAPAHCASGNDSIGRQVRCCPINSSAWAGLNTGASPLGLLGCLGLVHLHLLVEAVGDALQLVDGGVVLLNLDALHVVHGLLLLRGGLFAGFGQLAHGIVPLELNAGDVGVDGFVIFLDGLLRLDHLLERRCIAIRKVVRGRGITAVCIGRSGRQYGSRADGNEHFHTGNPRLWLDRYLSGATAPPARRCHYAARFLRTAAARVPLPALGARKQAWLWSFTTP